MGLLTKLTGRVRAETRSDGLVVLQNDAFIRLCAPYASGEVYIARGYRSDANVQSGLKQLREQNLIPNSDYRSIIVSIDEISDHYEGSYQTELEQKGSSSDSTPAQQKLEALLERAAKLRASDVKIAQYQNVTRMRLRVAGRDIPLDMEWTAQEGLSAMTAAFNSREDGGGHTTMARQEFQSFSVSRLQEGQKREGALRLPASVVKLRGQKGHHENVGGMGNHLVLRLLYDDKNEETGSLEDLGLDQDVLDELEFERGIEDGFVVNGGTTGNGKSTTMINLINQFYADADGHTSIVTFEDPVETRAKGDVWQVPVLSKGSEEEIGLAWRNSLRHLVRINPDVGVLGEMRDGASAEEALRFVASGHKVLSTIHVGSANMIPFRLINWGVAPTEVGAEGALSLLMRQVLLPKLCDHCKQPLSDEVANIIKKALRRSNAAKSEQTGHDVVSDLDMGSLGLFIRNPKGCSHCISDRSDTERQAAWGGYARMIAVAEFIRPDEIYRNAIIERNSLKAFSHWMKPKSKGGLGGITVDQRLARKIVAGELDYRDASRRARDLGPSLLQEIKRLDSNRAEPIEAKRREPSGGADVSRPNLEQDQSRNASGTQSREVSNG